MQSSILGGEICALPYGTACWWPRSSHVGKVAVGPGCRGVSRRDSVVGCTEIAVTILNESVRVKKCVQNETLSNERMIALDYSSRTSELYIRKTGAVNFFRDDVLLPFLNKR